MDALEAAETYGLALLSDGGQRSRTAKSILDAYKLEDLYKLLESDYRYAPELTTAGGDVLSSIAAIEAFAFELAWERASTREEREELERMYPVEASL
ncbi:MAG: hypothetical protein SVU32_03205 [Candidatus Nanohaloarchaea archaeon]|nr:hypothetical protein [Candidatus Nanohaloarchaea archaeon]